MGFFEKHKKTGYSGGKIGQMAVFSDIIPRCLTRKPFPRFFKKVEKFSSFSFNGETVSPLPHYRKKWQNLPLFHFGNKKPTHHPLFRLLPCGEGDNCRLRRKVSFFRHLI